MPTPMRVVSLVTQKGGSGKTTLCLNLAVAAEQAGVRCLIVDLDPQERPRPGTRTARRRRRGSCAARRRPGAGALGSARAGVRPRSDRHAGPGRAGGAAAAMRASDFCLVPCRPTPADMKAQPTTAATVRRLGKPMAFVLTQTPPRGFRPREAGRASRCWARWPRCPWSRASGFQDAHGAGLAITEFEPHGKGADEIPPALALARGTLEKTAHETPRKRTSLDALLRPPEPAAPRRRWPRRSLAGPLQTAGEAADRLSAVPVYEQLRRLAFEERVKMHGC